MQHMGVVLQGALREALLEALMALQSVHGFVEGAFVGVLQIEFIG